MNIMKPKWILTSTISTTGTLVLTDQNAKCFFKQVENSRGEVKRKAGTP